MIGLYQLLPSALGLLLPRREEDAVQFCLGKSKGSARAGDPAALRHSRRTLSPAKAALKETKEPFRFPSTRHTAFFCALTPS